MTDTIYDSDTEKIIMPAKHFKALIENKNISYKQSYNEAIELSGKLREEIAVKKAYQEALQKLKTEKDVYLNKCSMYEKEINSHKSKTKNTPLVDDMLVKMKTNEEYLSKNKESLIQDYYDKNCASKVDSVRKSLGLE